MIKSDAELTWAVYRRMSRALKAGRGVRISAEELDAMYSHDAAIMGVIENLRDEARPTQPDEEGEDERTTL